MSMSQLEIHVLLEHHRQLRVQAAKLEELLRPRLLQVGDKVTELGGNEEHEVVAVRLDEHGYGVELGKGYLRGGFVLRGECVRKVDP
jgi:hypothetical protein